MKIFPPFRLDPANQCLWRENTRISLAPKAFDVLRYLVEHPGRLVTQDELLEALWADTYVQPEVLRKYILEIRKVLEDPPKNPLFIETLPKRGYQFIAPVKDEAGGGPPPEPSAGPYAPPLAKLVGRESASAALDRFLSTALRGQRQLTFVTGEPGIGKTALVDAFQQRAASARNLRIARGQCVEGFGGKEAYYPVLEALGYLIHGPLGDRAVEILASQAPTWLIQFPAKVTPEQREALRRELLGATRERMCREICEALETLTAENPIVLILEDFQWVDDSTLGLISALARRRAPARLFVLATYRPIEVILAQGALKTLKQDLLVHRLCNEITLERLAEPQIEEYLQGEFPGGTFPKGLAGLVYHHSDGNPLFMVAMVEQLVKKGFIRQEQGSWAMLGPLDRIDPGVPETLQGMLEVQLDQLSPAEQRMLKVSTVAGRRFSVWTVNTTLESDPAEIEELCEGLVARQQIIRRGGIHQLADGSFSAQYEFKHLLYREVLYRQLPFAQRCQAHKKLAESMEALSNSHEPALASELALHFEEGRDYERAVRYLIVASGNAGLRYAHRDSIKLLQHALELLPRSGQPGKDLEVRILEHTSDAHYALGEMEQSADVDERVVAIAGQAGMKAAQVDALTRLARAMAFLDPDRCVSVCERAVEVSKGIADPLLQARVEMLAACWRIVTNGWQKKDAEICTIAREKIRKLSAEELPAYYEILYAHVQCTQGEYREGYKTAAEGIPRAVETHSLVVYLSALSSQSLALLHLGQWGELRRVLSTAIEMARKNGNDPWLGIFQVVLAWLHLHAFDFAGARRLSDELLGTYIEEPPGQVRFIAMLTKGFAELAGGNHDAAMKLFEKTSNRAIRPRFFLDWYWRMISQIGLSEACLATGKLSQATQAMRTFVSAASTSADPTLQALAGNMRARVAIASDDWTTARDAVAESLAAMNSHEVPAAAWRLYETAARVEEHGRNRKAAQQHMSGAAAILEGLANSFDHDDPLRASLLASSSARAIFNAAAG